MFLTKTVIISGIAVAGVIAAVFIANRRKSPRPLPPSKPALEFFPKYYISLPTTEDAAENLQAIMEKKGFRTVALEAGGRCFERGSVFGDFSIEWAKLRISEMEGRSDRLSIAYGGPALFDTGDLWKFTKELESYLTSSE